MSRTHNTAVSRAEIDKLVARSPTQRELKTRLEAVENVRDQIEWGCGWHALVASFDADAMRLRQMMEKKP